MVQTIAEPISPSGQRIPMSDDEWRTLDHAGNSEWIEKKALLYVTTTARHWHLLVFISTLLSEFVRHHKLGSVLGDSVEMRIGERSRVPDLMFVRKTQLGRLGETRFDGPANLVVELVSDDSVFRDFVEKKQEYAAAEVSKYWALDARRVLRRAEFYQLVNGVYQPIAPDADGRIWSTAVGGFWIKPAWLWEDPLPNALRCLAEISLDAYLDGLPPALRPTVPDEQP